jgi:hypothetical protein
MAHQIIIPNQEGRTTQLVSQRTLSGEFETVAITDVGDKRIFHYSQQTGNILNLNEKRRQESPDWNRNSDFRQVAAVPEIIWVLWESAGITNSQTELRKALMRHKDEYMVVEKNLI